MPSDQESTITARPLPPPLDPRCPDCSLCGRETDAFDGEWRCDRCAASWPIHIDSFGEWTEPEADQCDATCQPLANNALCSDEARAWICRCALTADHAGEHASTEYTYSTRGWVY
jgi:hypothetical protein